MPLLCGEDVWLFMCAGVRVGFDKKIIKIIIRRSRKRTIIIILEGSKSRGEIYIYQASFSLYTRWCRVGFEPYGGRA